MKLVLTGCLLSIMAYSCKSTGGNQHAGLKTANGAGDPATYIPSVNACAHSAGLWDSKDPLIMVAAREEGGKTKADLVTLKAGAIGQTKEGIDVKKMVDVLVDQSNGAPAWKNFDDRDAINTLEYTGFTPAAATSVVKKGKTWANLNNHGADWTSKEDVINLAAFLNKQLYGKVIDPNSLFCRVDVASGPETISDTEKVTCKLQCEGKIEACAMNVENKAFCIDPKNYDKMFSFRLRCPSEVIAAKVFDTSDCPAQPK